MESCFNEEKSVCSSGELFRIRNVLLGSLLETAGFLSTFLNCWSWFSVAGLVISSPNDVGSFAKTRALAGEPVETRNARERMSLPKDLLSVCKIMFLSEGPSIYPPSGFNYCVRIMSQIQSVLSLALNLYGASIMKPTASAPHTSCPGVTPGLCVLCVCVCLHDLFLFLGGQILFWIYHCDVRVGHLFALVKVKRRD